MTEHKSNIKFQLCNSITEEEALKLDSNYLANFKYDGCRIIAIKKDEDIILLNRRGHICNKQFSEIVDELSTIKIDFMIDGEVISLDDDFEKLQKRALTKDIIKIKQLQKDIPIKYMIFDIISWKGLDMKFHRLDERIKGFQNFQNLKHIATAEFKPIAEMLKQAKEQDREGIVIKRMDSYYMGDRNDDWRKCKFFLEEKIKVIKYTINPKGIRAEDDKGNAVQIAGEQHKEVKEAIDKNGFAEINIQFLDKTKDNRYRFPSFRGLTK